MTERQRGLAYGLCAYLLWGLFPLYFPLLEPASATEIVANRIVWSLVFLAALLAVAHRWSWLRALRKDRHRLLLLSAAATTIAINWGVYIYGVNSGQVVETSLGYFINPLVSVMFGVVLLHEELRRLQWIAVGLGAAAVVVLTVNYAGLPWIALVLAFAFGTYGLLKKTLAMPAVDSLAVETALLTPFAAGYLAFLAADDRTAVQTDGLHMLILLSSTGLITTVPLLLFGAAATRLPLSWVGLLQYTAPVLQFIIGVAVYNEQMPGARWIGFSLVWLALCLMTYDSIVAARRARTTGADLDIDAAAQEAH